MIVKVQRPLVVVDREATVLIYNRDHTVWREEPYTILWEQWFDGRLKRYARAHREGTMLVIDQITRDRDW